MPVKPENQFISGIHKYLPPTVYHMKNNNPYVGGIPDVWYSGHGGDLWVEYKYLQTTPVRSSVLPNLSELQALWLEQRYAEGRQVAVILGCPKGGFLYRDLSWRKTLQVDEYLSNLYSRAELAALIQSLVGDSHGNSIRQKKVERENASRFR
jgi:hypothetical protein